MDACLRSRLNTSYQSKRNPEYETTYKREFSVKRPSVIAEGAPLSQRFLIGSPFQLSGAVGDSIYMMDFSQKKNVHRKPSFNSGTNIMDPPPSQPQLPVYVPPRRAESFNDSVSDEIKQALRNQLDSTYQADFTGSCQGFQLPLAYNRARPFWRNQVPHTKNSEYRNHYQNHPRSAMHFGGRFAFSCRVPADAVVPQTLPAWKKKPLHSIYAYEISQKAPSELYMKNFVDSLSSPTN